MNNCLPFVAKLTINNFKVAKRFYLLLVLSMIGLVSNGQCIGPYQTFESFKSTNPTGWTLNTGVTAFTNTATTNSRSGGYLLQHTGKNLTIPAVYPSIVTTAITNPKQVSFYVNRSAASGVVITYDFQYSPDAGTNWYSIPAGTNTVNGVSITATIPTLPTPAGPSGWNLVSATFNTNNPAASYMFRISDTRNNVTGFFLVDDFSATTYTTSPNDNLIIVPQLGATTVCNPITVPAAGGVSYSFYDQGGNSDTYVKSQNQTLYFAPASAGEKVQFIINSFNVEASTKITVYNGNGTTAGTEFAGLNNVSTVTAGTTVTSTDASGYITVTFISTITAPALANFGFDITVKCISTTTPPAISSLSATSGCDGTSFIINGTNLIGATSITVGGLAATIGANTSTSITVTPANGSSGVVSVTTSAGTGTSGATTYTSNFIPTAVTVSTAGTYCASTTLTAANGGSGTMYYQGTASGGISTATPATSQLVSASGTYYFRAQSAGCWGTQGSATVTITNVPSAPAPAAAGVSTTSSITANWNAASGSPAPTGYFLDVATDNLFASMVSGYNNLSVGNVLTYNVTGLASGTTYYYRVRAINGCGTGSNFGVGSSSTLTPPPYCLPSGSGFGQDPNGITNVTMGTINNTTVIETNNYGNYTALSTNVFVGAILPFSITYRTGFTYDTTIWVDWNNDGDFADAGELVYQGNSTASIPTTLSGSFAVPLLNSNSVSTVGSHRLRIGGTDFGPLTDPCRAGSWQAFEDYTLNVLTVPPCSISVPSSLTTVNVTGTSAGLVWSDAASTPNTVYNYYVSTSNVAPPADGSDPVGMGTVTGVLSANVTGLTLGFTYYFWVRVKCGPATYSAWIGSAVFTTSTLDVVNMTSGSITTCNAKFYDSGGFSGAYNNGENFTYTFTPSSGSNLKVVFNSFATESCCDVLYIYDGPSTASPLLGTFGVVQIAVGQTFYSTTANGGSLTFRFTSDGSITSTGWDANITCVDVPTVTGFSPLFACAGSTPVVTLTGTNFTGASAVTFNGVAASSYTVVSATSMTVTLPVGATTGVVRVTTPTASGVSTTSFSVRPIPAAPNAGDDVAICNGQSTTLNSVVPPASNTLATTQLGGNGCAGGNMFNIVTGPSPVAITSFDITPNNTAVQTVNVYYRTGTYLGNETTAGAWTLLGSYSVNGVAKVLITMPVTNLPLLASTTYGFYINYDASYTNGANSYTNGEITINTGAGLCSLFGGLTASRTFNGVVNYQVTATPTFSWSPASGLSSSTIVNPLAFPITTTTYNVTTTVNGCTSPSDGVVVTVNPVPTTIIPTASANVCANAVVPVTVSGSATTYTWTSSVANTLFSDATGLTAYVAGSNTTTIYVKTPVTTTITATGTTLPGGCFTTATVTFTVVTKTYNAPFWSPGGAPVNDGTENIVFNAGNFTSTGNLSACSCTVTGATVTIATGHTLTLVNGLNVSSGSMTFNSGASLVQTNPIANTGNITYKRDSTPCFRNDYTYWSSPVAGQTLIGVSPATGSTGFFDYNPSISNWQQTPFASVMGIGKGYLIRVPSSYPLAPALPINFTANFIGVPNNGTIPVSIVYNAANGLNLIGNPYPSAINAAALVTDPGFNVNGSFLGGTIYLWSHNSNVNYVTGQYNQTDYAVWNILGGVNTYYTGFVGSGNSNAPNGNIAAGQGFFIKTVASGTAYFRNSMRSGGATNFNSNFYRTNAPVAALDPTADYEKHRIWLDVNNGVQAYKQLLVGYVQDGTDGLDRLFDGEMVDNGNAVSLYATVETKKLSIQGRGLTFTPNDTFALGFKTTVADSYTINLSDFDGLFVAQNIYLEDTLLNLVHDLKASPYVFASTAGVFESRFVLRFTALALGVPDFSENSVVVYKNDSGLHVDTGVTSMRAVSIYDVMGRLLTSQQAINATQTLFTSLPMTNQVILVQITTENGMTVTKKLVY